MSYIENLNGENYLKKKFCSNPFHWEKMCEDCGATVPGSIIKKKKKKSIAEYLRLFACF